MNAIERIRLYNFTCCKMLPHQYNTSEKPHVMQFYHYCNCGKTVAHTASHPVLHRQSSDLKGYYGILW